MLKAREKLKKISILYVEDDKDIRDGYTTLFSRFAKKLFVSVDGKEGLNAYIKHLPDLVITDSKMPIMDGLEMSKEIKKINKDAKIIFISADSNDEYIQEVKSYGITEYLIKPIARKELMNSIDKCIDD